MAISTGSLPPGTLKRLGDFTLADLEAVRLALRGDSVIDWHRLDFATLDEVDSVLRANEFDPDDPLDLGRMNLNMVADLAATPKSLTVTNRDLGCKWSAVKE